MPTEEEKLSKENKKLKETLEATQKKLKISMMLNDKYGEEHDKMKEKIDPKSGSSPRCEAKKLHRAEGWCQSKYTKQYDSRVGKLFLCKHHAKLLLNK